MPVNTSSTGATYGKSSDPLCPLGFHPQVRWPTRCKRCFRDYKEHTDDADKAKFGNLSRGASVDDDDPWSARRSGFQKSRSLDVSMMDTLSKYGGGSSSVTSSYASRTTSTTSTSSTSATTDDMPQWKKNMLERQKKEAEERNTSSYAVTSRYNSSSTTTSTSSSVDEEDYISRRRRERAEQQEMAAASSFRSRSVQPESSSSGYESTPEMRSYERYQQKKNVTVTVKEEPAKTVTFAEPSKSYGSSGSSAEPSKSSGYGSSYSSAEPSKSSGYGSSYSSAEPSKPSGYGGSYASTPTTTSSYGNYSSSSTSWSNSTAKNSASSTVTTTSSYSKPVSSSTNSTSSSTKTSTSTTSVAKKAEPETPSWKSSSSASTPSWKKPATPKPEEEKPKETASTPSWKANTPSWKKPAAEPEKKASTPSLGKISETSSSSSSSTTPSWKKKATTPVEEPTPLKQDTPTPNSKPAPSWKKSSATSAESTPQATSNNSQTTVKTVTVRETVTVTDDKKVKALETEIDTLKGEMAVLKKEKSNLQKERDEASKKPLSFETAKAAEASAELRRAKEKLSDYEDKLSKVEKEKNGLNVKVKELESIMEKKATSSGPKRDVLEMQAKLKFLENKVAGLESENDKLLHNVQNLEGELEEVQDNFKEEEADEYRNLKRDLETQSKNVRVLQFKLKKAERSISELAAEKAELEAKSKTGGQQSSYGGYDSSSKLRNLEKELEQKNVLVKKYEAQIADLRGSKVGKGGPVLSRTGSVEKSVEDQLLKDLQDSIERENDLKEQLNMAEDEANEMRKKLSRIEDENESLGQQLKKMTKGQKRSPSPAYGRSSFIDKDEGISADGEELSIGELKVQLEVSEGETGLLRKKVDNLLTENLKLTKEIREINNKLTDEKKKRPSSAYGKTPDKENSYYEQRIDELQTDLNTTRVKLIEKEREVERLDAQCKKSSPAGKKLSRTGSQDEDKIQVLEKEGNVLREKINKLENDNERLSSENKQLQTTKYGKKPASTQEKLQMDKFALEEKIKQLEGTIKEQTRKIGDLTDAASYAKKESTEIERLKKEVANLEFELTRVRSSGESDKRKVDKLEREVNVANDKAEKSQRDLISTEREKRKLEEDKKKFETQISKLEGDVRSLNRDKDKLKDESDRAKAKNRDNLAQTEEGLKAFKEQIETLKNELSEEKGKHRDTKRTSDDKVRQMTQEIREVKQTADDKKRMCSELEDKVTDLEDKWAKSKRINKQKQDKIDSLEKDLDASKASGSTSSVELNSLKTKLREAEKASASKDTKIMDLEKELKTKTVSSAGSSTLKTENDKLKKEIEDLKKSKTTTSSFSSNNKEVKDLKDAIAKHELTEEQLVIAKAKLSTEKEELEQDHQNLIKEYDTIRGELSTLRQTYNSKADDWIKEKLDLQHRMKDLQDSLISSAGEGWESERDRFKQIIEDRDSQITQLKIEGDVGRSQLTSSKKEVDELKLKLMDYEKMSKFQKAVVTDNSATEKLEEKLNKTKKELSTIERDHKSEMNNVKMKYDGKIAVMTEEIASLKAQASKYRREREHYKELSDAAEKKKSGRESGGNEISEYKSKISDLQYQIHALEDECSEAKLEASKSSAQAMTQKSTYEIQIAELNSKINEMEEESLIDSGRARIAGTRTKMELAWQKERESQKKLINELNTMARDLKATLLEVEKERDRERLEAKRKLAGMKGAFDEEQDDTKKQITDLQYDLLELRDAHAKLRTTNEKLRRDKEKFERERDEFRYLAKERSRTEQGEEKKVTRLLKDMEDFFNSVPQVLGDGALKPAGDISVPPRLDTSSKTNFKQLLVKLQDSRNELEAIHKMNEEEREKISAKRAMMKRTGSVETEGGNDSPRGRTPGGSSRTSGGSRFKKSVSIGETINEGDMWKSTDSRGSNESLASNASIPLPIPVRTRSAHGGNESGYSSDYNALSIRRLERDTSVDRLSTGSKESGMSTQSDWVGGEKKKKSGLIGKLKALSKNKDGDKEFGSGSDISSVSVSSNMSAFAKAARKRALSRDRGTSKEREKPKKPEEANQPFDKYFDAASKSGVGTSGSASGSAGSSSTLPRTYRRY